MLGFFDWLFIAMFLVFIALDQIFRARRFPSVKAWRLKGLVGFVVYFYLAGYAPILWDNWLGAHTLFDARTLPLEAAIPAGFLVLQLGIYAWHRLMHNVDFLWRWLHQMHHSAERVDIFGAFYFHPFDMLGWALVGSVMLVGVFGLSGEAAAIVNIMAAFCSMFQHTNIKTPRWLGFIITRPESHSVHHERDHHANNYGDIPLFDMLFGTFVNPREWRGQAGFYDGGSQKLLPLLLGKKIV